MHRKTGRFFPALLLLGLAAGFLYIAYAVVPDPEPGLDRYGFTLLFCAAYMSIVAAVAAAVLAVALLIVPRRRPE